MEELLVTVAVKGVVVEDRSDDNNKRRRVKAIQDHQLDSSVAGAQHLIAGPRLSLYPLICVCVCMCVTLMPTLIGSP